MSRWKIRRTRSAGDWEVYDTQIYKASYFPTWRRAMDYADRLARTREYVLPRIAPQGEVTVSAIWDYDSLVVHYINSAGHITQGTPADVKPLALTLLALALAEQEGK